MLKPIREARLNGLAVTLALYPAVKRLV
jgi:hypothetical protein